MLVMRNRRGFTIIEVVLVLAIAGLIFLMVFIALPALQRSQRNTQRRHDLERFAAAIVDYRTKNNGRVPFSTDQDDTNAKVERLVTRYIDPTCQPTSSGLGSGYLESKVTFTGCGSEFTDPSGNIYSFVYLGTSDPVYGWHPVGPGGVVNLNEEEAIKDIGVIYVANRFVCGSDENVIIGSSGLNEVVVMMYLEGGGIACETAN